MSGSLNIQMDNKKKKICQEICSVHCGRHNVKLYEVLNCVIHVRFSIVKCSTNWGVLVVYFFFFSPSHFYSYKIAIVAFLRTMKPNAFTILSKKEYRLFSVFSSYKFKCYQSQFEFTHNTSGSKHNFTMSFNLKPILHFTLTTGCSHLNFMFSMRFFANVIWIKWIVISGSSCVFICSVSICLV